MKVERINVKEFLEALDIVSNAIPNKSAIPCLTNVNLKFEDDKITLLGFDTITSIKKVIFKDNDNFEILESGNVLVDCKMLKAILSKLNCSTTDFYTNNNQFVIENGKSIYRLNMANLEEYPKVEFKKLKNEIVFKTKELINVIEKTIFATATNEMRPVLTGVNFNSNGNTLNCVATDSFRLSQYTISFETELNNVNFVFPKQSLLAMNKIISKTNEEYIKLLYDDNNKDILFNVDKILYKTRLLEGNYPNTSRLIAYDTCDKICSVNKDLLINALDRVSIFNDNNSQTIKLIFNSNNQLEVKSLDNSVGNGNEVIECDKCNFDLTIACNSKNLIEALNVFEKDVIDIYLSSELRPVFIKNEENVIELILPVRID